MPIGQFTKQLAQQAIGGTVKDAIDALRPSDAAALADSLPDQQQAGQSIANNLAATIVAQVQAMQNALKEDQELVVLCTAGIDTLRVLEFFVPAPRVVVLTGIDSEKTITRIVCPADALQLVCKPMGVKPGSKAARIRFVMPKTA